MVTHELFGDEIACGAGVDEDYDGVRADGAGELDERTATSAELMDTSSSRGLSGGVRDGNDARRLTARFEDGAERGSG